MENLSKCACLDARGREVSRWTSEPEERTVYYRYSWTGILLIMCRSSRKVSGRKQREFFKSVRWFLGYYGTFPWSKRGILKTKDVLLGWPWWYQADKVRGGLWNSSPRSSKHGTFGPCLASHRREIASSLFATQLCQCRQRTLQAGPLQSLPEDCEACQPDSPWVLSVKTLQNSFFRGTNCFGGNNFQAYDK